MSIPTRRFSRRTFLEATGIAAGLVPLLPERRGFAAEPRPRRLIVVSVPNGYTSDYRPTAPGPDWQASNVEFSPLKAIEPFKDRVLMVGGIDIPNGNDTVSQVKAGARITGHAVLPFLLTGARGVAGPQIPDGYNLSAGYPSVDQYVAANMPGAAALPFPSLALRPVRWGVHFDCVPLSYRGRSDGRTHNAPPLRDDPISLFDELFGRGLGDARAAQIRARKKSILDFSTGQLTALQRRVGAEDKARIEQHLDAVRQVEKQLASAGGPCGGAQKPEPAIWSTDLFNKNMHKVMQAQIEMTVAAMACDLTRVASHIWCQSNNNFVVFDWLKTRLPSLGDPWNEPENAGSGNNMRNHHTIAHNEGKLRREKNLADLWFHEQWAHFLRKLSETRDPDGRPMIESTLVLLAHQQRTGGGHQTDNLIWLLGGNADGYFKTGRWIPWLSGTSGQGAPQNGVLTAIVNAMGCPPVDHYGDKAYGGEATILRG